MPAKGEVFSEEAIIKMNASKHARSLSLMDWTKCVQYLDNPLENGSSGKENIYITLRQFKENMCSGKSIKQMVTEGISKHVLQFYSNLCQGKINLDKDTFINEYESGKELVEIAKDHNITMSDITYLRQLYDIKRKGAKYQHRKATEVSLTKRQKELIYGSLMGDGKRTSNNSVGFGHGNDQREYCFWKFNELNSVASQTSFKGESYTDPRTGYKGISWRFYTHANSDIEEIVTEFYKSGTKEITQKVLDNLSAFSVAVWYMDDGTTDFHYRKQNLGINHTPICKFCTDSFSYDSCLLIQRWFLEKWKIKVRIKERQLKDRIGYRVIVENEDTEKFISLIKPHILKRFLYKVDYDEYVKDRNELVSTS